MSTGHSMDIRPCKKCKRIANISHIALKIDEIWYCRCEDLTGNPVRYCSTERREDPRNSTIESHVKFVMHAMSDELTTRAVSRGVDVYELYTYGTQVVVYGVQTAFFFMDEPVSLREVWFQDIQEQHKRYVAVGQCIVTNDSLLVCSCT